MICKKCRKEIPDVSIYCMWCGRKQITNERIKRRPNSSGSVFKESGARERPWRAVASFSGKRSTVGYYATQSEALKALAAYEPPASSVVADMTVAQVYDAWGENKQETLSASAWATYEAAWKRMQPLADISIASLKTADYQKIIDQMKRTMSRSSCEKFRNLTSQLCQWAMQNDLIDKNYAEYLVLPQDKKTDDRMYFTDEEIDRLWEQRDVPAAQIVLVMIYTGMRINELFSLKPDDTHLDEEIAPGRLASYVIGGEKTDAGKNRIIMIHPKVLPFVREWVASGKTYLLTNARGGMIDDHNWRNREYYPLLDRLGIEHISPHKARHTFASRGAKAGMSPTVLQNLMGHEKYETTADYYTHVDLAQLADGIELLDK